YLRVLPQAPSANLRIHKLRLGLAGIPSAALTNPFIFNGLTPKMYVGDAAGSSRSALPWQAPKAWPDGLAGKQVVHPFSNRHGLRAETIRPAGAYVNLGTTLAHWSAARGGPRRERPKRDP